MNVITVDEFGRDDAAIGTRGILERVGEALNALVTRSDLGRAKPEAASDELASLASEVRRMERSIAREKAALRRVGWTGESPAVSITAYRTGFVAATCAGAVVVGLAGTPEGASPAFLSFMGGTTAIGVGVGLLVHAAWLGHVSGRAIATILGRSGHLPT